MPFRTLINAVFALTLTASCLHAQEEGSYPIPFGDGHFTIVENADMEKLLSFDGQELTSGYYLSYSQTVNVGGTDVALFEVGPGGNACGSQTFLVWKSDGEALRSVAAGDDCGSPSPSISDSSIYFVPYLLPGTTAPVQVWTPEDGLKIAGTLAFAPQPGSDWANLDITGLSHVVEAFSNEAILSEATALLGDRLTEVVTGLSVSDGFHILESGIVYGYGCVPHACSLSDSFLAIDQSGRKLYLAQQDGKGGQDTWPDLAGWPADVRETMLKTLND